MAGRFFQLINQKAWKKAIVIVVVIAVFLLALSQVDFDGFFKSLHFATSSQANWLYGEFGFLILGSLLVSIGCPRQVVSFFAAFYFGLWMGILLGLVATTLACMLSFSTARVFQTYFKDILRGKLKLAFDFWKQNTFFATMLWRFIPAGSNLLTNLVAGAFGISALPFIAGSAIGYIPHTVVFALLGAGVEVGSDFQIIASAVLLVVSILLGLLLIKKYRAQLS